MAMRNLYRMDPLPFRCGLSSIRTEDRGTPIQMVRHHNRTDHRRHYPPHHNSLGNNPSTYERMGMGTLGMEGSPMSCLVQQLEVQGTASRASRLASCHCS